MRHDFFCPAKNLGSTGGRTVVVGVQQNKYPAAGLAFRRSEQQVPTKLRVAVQEAILVDPDWDRNTSGCSWCLPLAYSAK